MTASNVLRASIVSLAVSACSTAPSQPAYDATLYTDCASLANCGYASNVCQYFAVAYPDGTFASQICTVTCANDTQCPYGVNGQIGFCAPYGFLGNEYAACIPRCYTDRDCTASMICADASMLSSGSNLPPGTLLCVPG